MKSEYEKFLQSKVIISEDFGFDIIERLINRYSMKGDTVFTPFMGIGSEVYQAVKMERKAIGFELKESYFELAKKNVSSAVDSKRQLSLI